MQTLMLSLLQTSLRYIRVHVCMHDIESIIMSHCLPVMTCTVHSTIGGESGIHVFALMHGSDN